jgi:GNAT superfamily N-acetyltransferase
MKIQSQRETFAFRLAGPALTFEHDELGDGQVLNAYWPDGSHAGQIDWGPDGEVNGILVLPKNQRKGVGTALWQKAKEIDPNIHHSTAQSEAGSAWARAVGD